MALADGVDGTSTNQGLPGGTGSLCPNAYCYRILPGGGVALPKASLALTFFTPGAANPFNLKHGRQPLTRTSECLPSFKSVTARY